MSKRNSLLLHAIVVVFIASPLLSSATKGEVDYKGLFKKVYAFGGSSTDSGNARLLGILKTRSFNKLDSFDRNGGLCDGNLMIDSLCESLGIPKLEPYKKKGADFSHGANFAIAGSPVVKKVKSMFSMWWKNMPDGIRMQLQWFDSFVKIENREKKITLEDALFWLGMFGADDYAEAEDQSVANFRGIANLNVQFVTSLIKGVSDVGARFIVVQGLPPLGCIPSGLSVSDPNDRDKNGCSAKINDAVLYHNDLIQKKINEIQSQNLNVTIVFADSYKAFMKVFNNYQRFHFSEPIAACCGYGGGKLNFDHKQLCGTGQSTVCPDPSKHINWDGIHFTAAMYQHMSSLFLFGTCSYPPFSEVRSKVLAQSVRDAAHAAKVAHEVGKEAAKAGAAATGAAVKAGAAAGAVGAAGAAGMAVPGI